MVVVVMVVVIVMVTVVVMVVVVVVIIAPLLISCGDNAALECAWCGRYLISLPGAQEETA